MTQTGEVQVDSHSFLVATDSADTLNPRATGSLIEVGDDYLRFLTGAVHGPVVLSVDVVDEMPALTDADRETWEIIEETSMKITRDLHVLNGGLDAADGFRALGLKRGTHHVRGYARGRDEMWDEIATEATEHYRVLIAKSARQIRLKQLKKTDAVWSAPVTFHPQRQWYEPDPASDASAWIYIGRDAYIEQQKETARQWGGRPPSNELVRAGALPVAHFDRPLADAIVRAKSEKQRTIAKWAAREACSLLGLENRPWARSYLAVLDTDEPLDETSMIDEYQVLSAHVETDPELDQTRYASPLPNHSATDVLGILMLPNRAVSYGDACIAAFVSIVHAQCVAGEEHLDLLRRIRKTFFPRLKPVEQYERWV